MRFSWYLLAGACCGALAAGCTPSAATAPAKATPAAKVATTPKEDLLNTITLTSDAEQRLGVETAAIELRKVGRRRTVGGEIALPTGAAVIVSAPLGGTLRAPTDNADPQVGVPVRRRQVVFMLLPLLSPERSVLTPAERIRFAESRAALARSQIDAEEQVLRAQVQLEATKITLARAERLLRENAGSAQAVDDAKAQVGLAQKSLDSAEKRLKLLAGTTLDEEAGTLDPLPIEAPQDGILRAVHAAAGEVVAPGAPLFEVLNLDAVWVKTPVYVGELADVALDQPARISDLNDTTEAGAVLARPVAAPPTATPLSATADLYYELANPGGKYRPGQRVGVSLALNGDDEGRTIPWSAVVQDINGGTWVYERTAPQTYVRRRVQVRFVLGDLAVLAEGPATGAMIVVEGAAELFGTEFGAGK